MHRDPAQEDWVIRARAVRCEEIIGRWPHQLKRKGRELVGPCPACGGDDRFSIDLRKNLWHCRKAGKGGDAIALVEYVDGVEFRAACEILTGEPRPGAGHQVSGVSEEQRRARWQAAEEQRARDDKAANDFRTREIARAHEIWDKGRRIAGTMAERYLLKRGLTAPAGAKLRAWDRLVYWHQIAGEWRQIHEGPAMLAAIVGPDGRFQGVHCTWIDLSTRSGKAEIADPATGELLAAKKVRGSARGGHIPLSGPSDGRRLVMGEGIETTLSAFMAEEANPDCLYWAGVSLGNLGGRAADRLRHPTERRIDAKGRDNPVVVPGCVPALPEHAGVLLPPESVRTVILLGDGDSDRFITEQVLKRAARRFQFADAEMTMPLPRDVRAAWADAGGDFNSMLLQPASEPGEKIDVKEEAA